MSQVSEPNVWLTSPAFWPDTLVKLALPAQEIIVNSSDVAVLVHLCATADSAAVEGEDSVSLQLGEELIEELDDAIGDCPHGAHLKFDLCSLKSGMSPPKFHSSADFIKHLALGHRRLHLCLSQAQMQDAETRLFVYPWAHIPQWSEFRVFIQSRKIVGISQYHHSEYFSEISPNITNISIALLILSQILVETCHLDSFVADCYVEKDSDSRAVAKLIELNPFVQRSDACLFSWKEFGNCESTIRFRNSKQMSDANRSTNKRLSGVSQISLQPIYQQYFC